MTEHTNIVNILIMPCVEIILFSVFFYVAPKSINAGWHFNTASIAKPLCFAGISQGVSSTDITGENLTM